MSIDRWILSMALCTFLNFIPVLLVQANVVSYCIKKTTYPNVILRGKMEAGTYTPWEPGDLSHMTVDRCTEHCCKSPDTDVVFLLNSYCFCVKCHSLESCAMVKITPPSTYRPVIVTVLKRISKLPSTTQPLSATRSFTRRTKSTEYSTQPTTVKFEQKETKGTKRPQDAKTDPTKKTSGSGFRRGNGTEISQEWRQSSSSYVNFTTLSSNSTGITTPRPTRVVTTEKKAEGTGNDDISLQCSGTITVIRVRALGIPGDTSTVDDFNKHCQANLGQVDGTNVCIVSLKRVYKSRYPPFIKTVVTYTCSYTEEIS